MHTREAEMSPVVGCVLAPSAWSDNFVHSLKKITHLLLRNLFGIFVNNLCELLDRPIICLLLKQMGTIGPKALFCKLLAVLLTPLSRADTCPSEMLQPAVGRLTCSPNSICLLRLSVRLPGSPVCRHRVEGRVFGAVYQSFLAPGQDCAASLWGSSLLELTWNLCLIAACLLSRAMNSLRAVDGQQCCMWLAYLSC